MRLKKGIMLLFSVLLLFSGCGKENSGAGGDGKRETTLNPAAAAYAAEWEEFKPDLGEDVYIADEILAGDCLYYGYTKAEGEELIAYIGCKELLSGDESAARAQGEGYISHIFAGADGTPWCIRNVFGAEGESAWWLEQTAFSGEEPMRVDISDCFEESEYPQDVVMDENGYVYILGGEIGKPMLKAVDSEGKCVRTLEVENGVSSLGVLKGKGILLGDYNGNTRLFDLQTQDPTDFELGSGSDRPQLSAQEDGSLLFTDGSVLKRYQPESRETEEITDLANLNVVQAYLQDMHMLSDGRIALLTVDWSKDGKIELAFLKEVSKDEIPEKTVLTLGTVSSDSELDTAVADFNKKNSTCQIEIVEYYTNDWAAAHEKLKQDVATGQGPDLLDMRYLGTELDTYLEKGILEDLTPYLENSEQIRRDDFLPNMLEAYTQDGVLYCIPDRFSIHTLVGRSSEVGAEPGWTREEFMDYAAGLPEDTWLLQYQNKVMMLYWLLGPDADPFVNRETGESHLDAEEFREYLEFANRFPMEEPGISYDQVPELLGEGKLKLYGVYMRSMRDLQDYYNYFGDPVTCIGYPTGDGSGGAYLSGSGIMLGVNNSSKEKEAAWEFISTQLTRDAQQNRMDSDNGFPSRKDVLEEYFEKSMEGSYLYDENGEPLLDENGEPMQVPLVTVYMTLEDGTSTKTEYFASRPEDVELVKNLISSITESDDTSRTVVNMILEESDDYFNGRKGLEETIAVMQSRVQLYLDEKK